MIKFFRKIRQELLVENRFNKYLLYAIGEIVLVVIGILIALQINNWNENRKNQELVKKYLVGIKNDLNKDLKIINKILDEQTKSIAIINSIDSIFNEKIHQIDNYKELLTTSDSANFKMLFYRGLSFRSSGATYHSLVSDGKSGLIKNRALFEEIQGIYDVTHHRINSIYETLKDRDEHINWTYAREKKHWNYSDLVKAKEAKIFLDLSNFTEIKYFYSQQLVDLKAYSQNLITLINKEIIR